jgi:hypothetical protein
MGLIARIQQLTDAISAGHPGEATQAPNGYQRAGASDWHVQMD